MSLTLDEFLDLIEAFAETIKHCPHVTALLHGDDARVVLLVDPYKKILVVVVKDSTRIRPVTCHTGARQKRGDWFVKQEVIVNQLLLFGCGHAVQRIVATSQVT